MAFVAIAYAFSWSFFVPMIIARTVIVPLIVIASFGPFLAAITIHRLATGNFRAFRIVSSWPRTILGTLIGVVLVVMAYVILPAMIAADARQLRWNVLFSVSVYNASTLFGGPLGEEPGWRGYALPRLQKRFGPVVGTLLVGLIWTGWHLPLFLVPGWTSSPIWTFTLMLCGLSLLITYSFNLAGLSIVAAIAAHAVFNTVSKYLGGLLKGAEIRIQIPFETLLALCGLVIAIGLIAATKGRLAYCEKDGRERIGQAQPVNNNASRSAMIHESLRDPHELTRSHGLTMRCSEPGHRAVVAIHASRGPGR